MCKRDMREAKSVIEDRREESGRGLNRREGE